MRATTLGIRYVSRAIRTVRMLVLSPLVTAARASAPTAPARSRSSRSKPEPTICWPFQPGGTVDDGHRVAVVGQAHGQPGADPATSHHDHVHRSRTLRSPQGGAELA